VYKEADDGYSIELALAGFKKEDIRIEHDKKNSLITITGDNSPRTQQTTEQMARVVQPGKISSRSELVEAPRTEVSRQVIRQGIANRSFTRSFTVADDLLVDGATLEDGLLTVKLKKLDLPENRPLLIPIA
jgi:HSP20 family molecular chaperone IbpA